MTHISIQFLRFYFLLGTTLLLFTPKATLANSRQRIENVNDSIYQYKVSAYFVDKTLRAHSTVEMYGNSLESIMTRLNAQRNGLGIIIGKVWIVRKNRKEELLLNLPPGFMKETDSLLGRKRISNIKI